MTYERDPRYSSAAWRRLRKMVLRRDGWSCWARGCGKQARIADHIERVYPGMPDAEFYDPANLRASCYQHNYYLVRAAMDAQEARRATPRRVTPFAATRGIAGVLGRPTLPWGKPASGFFSRAVEGAPSVVTSPSPNRFSPLRGDYSSRTVGGRPGATRSAAS